MQLVNLTSKHIPLRNIPVFSETPWFNVTSKRLSNKKKRKFRTAKFSNSDVKWSKYHDAAKAYKCAVAIAKTVYFSVTLPSLLTNNPKQFWNLISHNKNQAISLSSPSGEPVPLDDYANVFNSAFVG